MDMVQMSQAVQRNQAVILQYAMQGFMYNAGSNPFCGCNQLAAGFWILILSKHVAP